MARLTRFLAALALLLCVPLAAYAEEGALPARLEALAEQGNAEAAYHLGMIHHLGLEGVDGDPRRAFHWFRRAADGGDPLGAYKVGCFYAGQGDGVVEDDEELALRYKLVAAEAGYDLAQIDVARMFHERGDVDRALHWLEVAARQGNMQGAGGALVYRSPQGPRPDAARAWLYFELLRRDLSRMLEQWPEEEEEAERPSLEEMSRPLGTMLGVDGIDEADRERGRQMLADWREERSVVSSLADLGLEAAHRLAATPRQSPGS